MFDFYINGQCVMKFHQVNLQAIRLLNLVTGFLL